ncbi:DUF3422 domain-containing protein [Lutimaribacter sp. EGI FJ00015]|uniref:DUF3422 domain-containing protein n=1 Tax=Lutimaribacter degradans TaxID=2945989 RepID=A0ACC5ZR73_9RHOB|nr:DUF3422 domain-containing protein [Lutimaribacter sp. EGI FJ00013]MCM2560828.1 DUF3422 domain-containing protein [Lutimaribacter sp. EGI FJ00013]MCO0612227.1 DUF3422 domain-containing protein [Lutimaribacter sp. EGI FJ00015]MCO0634653.1 DUF3422 domain-containing protein [Lutimaribacter sp. EGI FJ00014]
MAPISDHPLRYSLANELHARPFPSIETPSTAVYLAVKQPENAAGRNREADMAHLVALLDRYGAPHPQPGATHYFGHLGRYQLKWESHTEFVTYTAFIDGLSARPFDPADFEVFPSDWLDDIPGVRMTSALIRVEPWSDKEKVIGAINDWFVPESIAVSRVLDDAAVMAGDFRIDAAGHQRFAIFAAPGTGSRRIGRLVQRLCEVETYKTMSMLGFSEVKAMSPRMNDIDARLTNLMEEMTDNATPAEDTLRKLLEVSAELETMVARAAFRFGATEAYEAIVHQRIEVMRESRFDGRQTFNEFMMRRYDPAMRTVQSTKGRLAAMSDRAIRAGDLLRTRVDVERSAQNQALLESMNTRADMQLKLQRTVEGLSVVAISYYAVSLAAYALFPLTEVTGLSKGALTAVITLPVVLLVWWLIRRLQRSLHSERPE